MVKVFLVDDHEVVRRGLADLLASDPELEIVGEAATFTELGTRIQATAKKTKDFSKGPDFDAFADKRRWAAWSRFRLCT